jgi:hypothetical protein
MPLAETVHRGGEARRQRDRDRDRAAAALARPVEYAFTHPEYRAHDERAFWVQAGQRELQQRPSSLPPAEASGRAASAAGGGHARASSASIWQQPEVNLAAAKALLTSKQFQAASGALIMAAFTHLRLYRRQERTHRSDWIYSGILSYRCCMQLYTACRGRWRRLGGAFPGHSGNAQAAAAAAAAASPAAAVELAWLLESLGHLAARVRTTGQCFYRVTGQD